MKERPILFSGAMVRAILEGRKTQTRRVVKPQPEWVVDGKPLLPKTVHVLKGNDIVAIDGPEDNPAKKFCQRIPCPYGVPGDRLWVRETWGSCTTNGTVCSGYRADVAHRPEIEAGVDRWRPSIHMPRWASRLLLEVKAVRVERLREISQDDAQREGMRGPLIDPELDRIVNQIGRTPRECFGFLWDSINAKRGHSWESNPWVWVVEFERVTA